MLSPYLRSGAFVAAAALGLAACSSGSDVEAAGDVDAASADLNAAIEALDPDEQVEIVFESYNLQTEGVWTDTVNQLLEEFEAEHPNISVTGQPPLADLTGGNSATASSVQQQLLAGDAPDVAQLTFDTFDFAVNALGTKSIESLVGTEAVEEHLGGEYPMHERAAALGEWDGQQWAMPYVFSTPVMFYNADAVEAAGIDPDTMDVSTWDALAEVATQVGESVGTEPVALGCVNVGGDWCMQGIIASAGGSVLSDDRSTITFGEEGSVTAVEKMRELADEGVIANLDVQSQLEAAIRGEVTFIINSSALQGYLQQSAEAGGWELRSAPLPGFEGMDAVPTNSGSALFILSDDPAKQAAAWELTQFLTSERAYELITSQIGYLPLRTGLTEGDGALADWLEANPLAQPNLDQLENLEPWVSYPGDNYSQVTQIVSTAIEEAVFYGEDPEAAMTDAAERAQDLINE
ncbi:ABC transporter substrate-binding protein [Demequina flava]|uniref:ABC transporter substrate-binding protein n=1 Tax=Demequina flava TaxID=1095025 RepID=UPI0007837A6B|nr:ABC transporter substrate-binding protein [Demequina flava]